MGRSKRLLCWEEERNAKDPFGRQGHTNFPKGLCDTSIIAAIQGMVQVQANRRQKSQRELISCFSYKPTGSSPFPQSFRHTMVTVW